MKKYLKFCLICIGVFMSLLFFVFLGHFVIEHSLGQKAMQVVQRHQIAWAVGRYSVYGFSVFLWPKCIAWVGHYRQWPTDFITYLAQQRLKLFVFLSVLEVLLVHNGLAKLFRLV